MFVLKPYIQSLRPSHWTKNLLVFSAPLFNFNFNQEIWFPALIALLSFCSISSCIYQINDLVDIESDKKHPKKKYRSIASGQVKKKTIFFSISILFALSLIISNLINTQLLIIIIIYGVIQILYCVKFKNQPIVDLFCIASGFLLRSSAGALASNLYISPWFYLTVGLLALFLAIEKRKAEILLVIKTGKTTRDVLNFYSLPLLLRFENIVATGSFLTYALWASGPKLGGAPTSLMLITVPLVLIGIFRYQLISDPELNLNSDLSVENPVNILLSDKAISFIVTLWVLTTLVIGLFTSL